MIGNNPLEIVSKGKSSWSGMNGTHQKNQSLTRRQYVFAIRKCK